MCKLGIGQAYSVNGHGLFLRWKDNGDTIALAALNKILGKDKYQVMPEEITWNEFKEKFPNLSVDVILVLGALEAKDPLPGGGLLPESLAEMRQRRSNYYVG